MLLLSVVKNQSDRVMNQGSSKQVLLKMVKKAFHRHPEAFQKYVMA